MTFSDHFSSFAPDYAVFRPRYPEALFTFLAGCAPARRLAWDCATGNGQAALGLAPHFERVVATDASAAQIEQAVAHARIDYRVARAEASGLAGASIDLITVAQAAHWFDLDAFFAEARRVLVERGVIAIWCYSLLAIEPGIDALVRTFYTETVGSFWPAERRLVDAEYRSLRFPFDELRAPELSIEQDLTLDGVAGYLGTWSATQRFRAERGFDPVAPFVRTLAPRWGADGRVRRVRWPLHLRVGRCQDAGG